MPVMVCFGYDISIAYNQYAINRMVESNLPHFIEHTSQHSRVHSLFFRGGGSPLLSGPIDRIGIKCECLSFFGRMKNDKHSHLIPIRSIGPLRSGEPPPLKNREWTRLCWLVCSMK